MIKIKIAEIVDEIKLTIMRILKRDAKSTKEKEKSNKSEKSKNISIEIENSFYSSFAMFSSFAIDSISYKLFNC
jgi:hypothetical protein